MTAYRKFRKWNTGIGLRNRKRLFLALPIIEKKNADPRFFWHVTVNTHIFFIWPNIVASRLRFVDEYLFNNQYSFPINSISIIVHTCITNPLNTDLIYVIVIIAEDKIKFLSFRQSKKEGTTLIIFSKNFCRGESSLGKTIEKWISSSVDKFDFLQKFSVSPLFYK